jgi:hypothetical protein
MPCATTVLREVQGRYTATSSKISLHGSQKYHGTVPTVWIKLFCLSLNSKKCRALESIGRLNRILNEQHRFKALNLTVVEVIETRAIRNQFPEGCTTFEHRSDALLPSGCAVKAYIPDLGVFLQERGRVDTVSVLET